MLQLLKTAFFNFTTYMVGEIQTCLDVFSHIHIYGFYTSLDRKFLSLSGNDGQVVKFSKDTYTYNVKVSLPGLR